MIETDNFKLKLPEGNEAPDVEIINYNMELIDKKMKESIDQVELGEEITE